MKESPFISPTKGALTFEGMIEDILAYMAEDRSARYKCIVGTDSHHRDEHCFVTAIIVHRAGKGARYYYRKRHQHKIHSLRQKIFYETAISLAMAQKMTETLKPVARGFDMEVHLDVGEVGDTKDLIREVVGMVVGSGFHAEIKPNAYGASKVADKYTK